jgi:hypothetical protein
VSDMSHIVNIPPQLRERVGVRANVRGRCGYRKILLFEGRAAVSELDDAACENLEVVVKTLWLLQRCSVELPSLSTSAIELVPSSWSYRVGPSLLLHPPLFGQLLFQNRLVRCLAPFKKIPAPPLTARTLRAPESAWQEKLSGATCTPFLKP